MTAELRRKKLLDLESLSTIQCLHPNSKIVHCHGVFDVIHAGHLAYFESAKKFGDILIITITSDEYVNKGPGRPYFNSNVRANMLAALEVVDYVAINRAPLAVPVIEALKPHFYVKGPDYKDKAADITGGIYTEEAAVEKNGGRLVFTDDVVHSSSTLINKFFTQWTEDQIKSIEAIKRAGGLDAIESILEKVSEQTACVIGEPIVDTYIFCTPESISSKSPSISAKFMYEENYAGGSLAIANHLADFVKDVSIHFTHGNEPFFRSLLENKMDSRIAIEDQSLPNIPTPRKTRFISVDKSQRMFEITDLRSDQWIQHTPAKFCSAIQKRCSNTDVTIVADFGHGLFEGPALNTVNDINGFVGLNVQTNSSNLGFNPFTKHKKFSFLSIDTKEARIAYHDRFTAPLDLARRVRLDVGRHGASFAMTLGSSGAYFFPNQKSEEFHAPAFVDSVVDATGAGDAFFALTSMLVKVGCPDVMVPFLGNIFAGLKTKIIGNKSSVTRAQLTKAVTAILK